MTGYIETILDPRQNKKIHSVNIHFPFFQRKANILSSSYSAEVEKNKADSHKSRAHVLA